MAIEKYCMKRNETFRVGCTSEDYCVDCSYYDSGECWVSDLHVKYIDGEPVHLIKPTAKILEFKKKS